MYSDSLFRPELRDDTRKEMGKPDFTSSTLDGYDIWEERLLFRRSYRKWTLADAATTFAIECKYIRQRPGELVRLGWRVRRFPDMEAPMSLPSCSREFGH